MAAAETSAQFIERYGAALAQVYGRSRADSYRVDPETLAEALYRGACSLPDAGIDAVGRYLASVYAEELALACALIAGDGAAWDEFITRYRPILYGAARAIAHDEPRARELADSLWAELYGIRTDAGARRPLLAYFHGRSSIRTWLHAVLARRYIDMLRGQRREEPLENVDPRELAVEPDPPNPEQSRYLSLIGRALNDALGALKPRDRLRLAYHYGDGLTLKEIGALMDEREWTVSRRLKRSRESMRKQVERTLRAAGLGSEQIRQCYDYALEGWSFELKSGAPVAPAAMQQKPGSAFKRMRE
ncbi:MAG TPA: sigma-70 family RNA polymerase sigma factor [Candidatus Binataceae bacterium]|nr:sigma-70 family RNA polymerase sigma factor [Candidatus Binataceae bacterium]